MAQKNINQQDIAQLFAVSPKKDCPHISDIQYQILEQLKDNIFTLPCSQCQDKEENWLCLTCVQILCSRYRNSHMILHSEKENHLVALSLSDLSYWCFSCNSYIINDALSKYMFLYSKLKFKDNDAKQSIEELFLNKNQEQQNQNVSQSSNKQLKFPSIQETISKFSKINKQFFDLQDVELVQYDERACNPNYYELKNEKIQKMIDTLQFESLGICKALGCFCGQVIGDSLGCHYEGQEFDQNRKTLQSFELLGCFARQELGQWTDDTSMSICIADSILSNNRNFNGLDLIHRFFLWFFSGYSNGKKNDPNKDYYSIGIGQSTIKTLQNFLLKQEIVQKEDNKLIQNNGNGSIMRICPIPIAFHQNVENALNYASNQSYTTHSGEEAAQGCQLLTYILIQCLQSQENSHEALKQILDSLSNQFKCSNPAIQALASSKQEIDFTPYEGSLHNSSLNDRNWNWKDPNFNYSSLRIKQNPILIGIYSTDCIAMSLHILYYTPGFKNALLKGINLGGDADSVGSIIGMIAGAMYGFNEEIKEFYKYVQKWDENLIAARAYELYTLYH